MSLDKHTEWSQDTYILARLSDAMEVSNYLFIQANSDPDKSEPPPHPEPLERPGDPEEVVPEKPKPEEFASGQEVVAFFNMMNNL